MPARMARGKVGKGRCWLSSSPSSSSPTSQRDVINKCTWERSLINSLELNQKPKVQEATWHLALGRRTWPITRNFLFTRPRNGARIPLHHSPSHCAPYTMLRQSFSVSVYSFAAVFVCRLSPVAHALAACLPACVYMCVAAPLLGPVVACTILPNPARFCRRTSHRRVSGLKTLWSCSLDRATYLLILLPSTRHVPAKLPSCVCVRVCGKWFVEKQGEWKGEGGSKQLHCLDYNMAKN